MSGYLIRHILFVMVVAFALAACNANDSEPAATQTGDNASPGASTTADPGGSGDDSSGDDGGGGQGDTPVVADTEPEPPAPPANQPPKAVTQRC